MNLLKLCIMDNLVYVMLPCGALFIIFTTLLIIFISSRASNFLFCWSICFGFALTSSVAALFFPGENLWLRMLWGTLSCIGATVAVFLSGTLSAYFLDYVKDVKQKELTFKEAVELLINNIKKFKISKSVSD